MTLNYRRKTAQLNYFTTFFWHIKVRLIMLCRNDCWVRGGRLLTENPQIYNFVSFWEAAEWTKVQKKQPQLLKTKQMKPCVFLITCQDDAALRWQNAANSFFTHRCLTRVQYLNLSV